MIPDRPFLGILLMLGFCILAPLGDALAKVLGGSVALGLLVTTRFAVQATVLAPIVALGQFPLRMTRRVAILMIVRTGLHILGIGTMFMALRFLPLADAIAIAFVMPFVMLLLGKTVLGESVGWHRLAACAVGFAGTLLVVQPNFATVGAPALLPLAVAVIFALFMLVTRTVARQISPVALQFVSGIVASAVLVPAMIFAPLWHGFAPFELPTPKQIYLLLLMGAVGTVAHLLMTWSLRFAPSATLAPMQYLEIPVATLFGWLIFRDLPNGLAAVGIVITVAAGLYVIWRARPQEGRAPLRPAPPAAE